MYQTSLFLRCPTQGDTADEVPAACVEMSRFGPLHNVMIEVAPTAHKSHRSPLNSKSVSQHCILFRNIFCAQSSSMALVHICAPSSSNRFNHPLKSLFPPSNDVSPHIILWIAWGSQGVPFDIFLAMLLSSFTPTAPLASLIPGKCVLVFFGTVATIG